MALFTKLFPRLRTANQNNRINEDSCSSEKLCLFDAKQVRLVLFRECDFRGRKLLFDSDATQKILVEKKSENENFVEVSNGFGYLISKQNFDYAQLSEMIFGSVAMSFRGTYFKIHSLYEPFRLMFTQVFPSPHLPRRRISSSSHHSHLSTRSFDQSIRLDDDSGASSTYSSEQQLSDRSSRSTASDTVLVWKRLRNSPVHLPRSAGILSKNSLIVDSGCGDNHSSFSSVSTGPLKFDTWESAVSYKGISTTSLASFTHLKHLLRSSSHSLHGSTCSLSNSADDVIPRGHHRSSKLGLAVIIDIPEDRHEFLTQFLMEHIALLESMLWRMRLAIETAYHRPPSFISTMMELSNSTARWLVSLLTAPRLFKNFWHCLSLKTCDNFLSINNSFSVKNRIDVEGSAKNSDLQGGSSNGNTLNSELVNRTKSCNFLFSNSDNNHDNKVGLTNSMSYSKIEKSSELFGSFKLGKFLKTDLNNGECALKYQDGLAVESFLKEFCEVLEVVDVKDTNFFVSTLLTAVLTHHLGWVATCFPHSPETSTTFREPFNSLWSQLTDLYGAVGHPVKTAQTIVTGNNKNNVITKILNSLTYFIRFSNVERKTVERSSVNLENQRAEMILTQADFIPKESYKKYEDHVRELLVSDSLKSSCNYAKEEDCFEEESKRRSSEDLKITNEVERNEDLKIWGAEGKEKASGLSKVKTLTNLSSFNEDITENNIPETEEIHSLNKTSFTKLNKKNEEKTGIQNRGHPIKKLTNLTKVSTHAGNLQELCSFVNEPEFDLDLNENVTEKKTDSNVIFVLGDDEKLVNIKKEQTSAKKEDKTSGKLRRRNSLHDVYATESTKDDVDTARLRKTSVFTPEKTEVNIEITTKKSMVKRPTFLNLSENQKVVDPFREEFVSNKNQIRLKPSSSHESLLCTTSKIEDEKQTSAEVVDVKRFSRCKSEPPESHLPDQPKFKYSRVKFNLQQYPQVVRNYMKSKNLELANLPFEDKVGDQFCTVDNNAKLDFSDYDNNQEICEALQTPSNASELEGTSELSSTGQEEWSYGDSGSSKKEIMTNIVDSMKKSEPGIVASDASVKTSPNILKNIEDSELNSSKSIGIADDAESSKKYLSGVAEKLGTPKLRTSKSSWVLGKVESVVQSEQLKAKTVKMTELVPGSHEIETFNIQTDSNNSKGSSKEELENGEIVEKNTAKTYDIYSFSSVREDTNSQNLSKDKLSNITKKLESKLKSVKSSWVLDGADSTDKNEDICGSHIRANNSETHSNEKSSNNVENLEKTKGTTVRSGWILGRGDSIDKNQENGCSIIQKDWIGGEDGEKYHQDANKLGSSGDKETGIPMKMVELPMPETTLTDIPYPYSLQYSSTVIKGLVDTYIPDMVLQGTTSPEKMWNTALKTNLALNAQHSLLDQPVEESLAILANTDTWEVQVISSHTYVIDKNASGVRVGMSQLVSNMLESLLQMWKSQIPPQYCLIHIEQKLQELCMLSKALAQLLLASEFCSMELLTSTLHLEVNDVPLLMAVASTHTPQVTEKYGLSFQ